MSCPLSSSSSLTNALEIAVNLESAPELGYPLERPGAQPRSWSLRITNPGHRRRTRASSSAPEKNASIAMGFEHSETRFLDLGRPGSTTQELYRMGFEPQESLGQRSSNTAITGGALA